MIPSISKFVSSALACTLLAGGCGYGECSDDVSTIAFTPSGPGTAAARIHGATSSRYAYVAARWSGTAINRASEPCRIAIYEHRGEPEAAQIPVLLRDQAAPATAGEGQLLFESLLPGVRDGHALVRKLEIDNALGDSFGFGDYLQSDDEEDIDHINVWLTVATCEAPMIEVNLEITPELCPARAPGSVVAEAWWGPDAP